MKWGTEWPTVPGWYWTKFRYREGDPLELRIGYLGASGAMYFEFYEDIYTPKGYDSAAIVEWAGPIPYPVPSGEPATDDFYGALEEKHAQAVRRANAPKESAE